MVHALSRRALATTLTLSLLSLSAVASAASAASAADSADSAEPRFTVTDLGSLGGNRTQPAQINDRGMVTGDSTRHARDNQGVPFFQWKHHFIGLSQRSPGSRPHGTGINGLGTVTGYDSDGPFVWTADGVTWLPIQLGRASAINDAGVVVGSGGFHVDHAWRWQDGAVTDLGTAGGRPASFADALNEAGDIVGAVGEPGQLQVDFMTDFDGVMVDHGTFGMQSARATGVNAARQVCGTAQETVWGVPHAFVWQGGVVTWLDGLPDLVGSEARAIDEAGNVVGEARLAARDPFNGPRRHAFLWRASDHRMFDLNDALVNGENVRLTTATSLNARGQIVGIGQRLLEDGRVVEFGFRLDPVR